MKLTYKNGRENKIHISVDGTYRLTVDSDYWFTSKWFDKKEVDESELEALTSEINCRRAFNNAVSLLSMRAHSRKELYQKLLRKYDRDACVYACDRAEALGLTDDRAFAELYVRELHERKKMGISAIKAELYKKGIAGDIADEAIEQLEIDPEACILDILQRKYAGKLSDEKGRRRAFAALTRLGYSYYDIRRVMDAFICEKEYEDDI